MEQSRDRKWAVIHFLDGALFLRELILVKYQVNVKVTHLEQCRETMIYKFENRNLVTAILSKKTKKLCSAVVW